MKINQASLIKLLQDHTKPIVHMWRQIREQRLGLVLGAGVSRKLGAPDWKTLITDIAKHPKVNGNKVLKGVKDSPASTQAAVLFEHFRAKLRPSITSKVLGSRIARRQFHNVVRSCLYKRAKQKENILLKKHPYIEYLLPIVERIPMTVTYNFDDFLERLLLHRGKTQSGGVPRWRDFETVWVPVLKTRRHVGVIYHPNGYLPKTRGEPESDELVFCEDEFADQLIDTISGHYAALLQFFCRQTCLLIGISLNDSTLKHLLRQNALINPGHYHYCVYWENPQKPTPLNVREAISKSNFEVHNLITLFLTDREIALLAYLLGNDDTNELSSLATAGGVELGYYYYITSVPGGGKSSCVSSLRSFVTYDEWLDERRPDMVKRYQKLGQSSTGAIDRWVARQFAQKNRLLFSSVDKHIGIHVLDRSVLDPMSFKKPSQRKRRAETLLNAICGPKRLQDIRCGMILLLLGDPSVIEERCQVARKDFTKIDLEDMFATLERAYSGPHLRKIPTDRRGKADVVKEIVRIIYKEQYCPLDLKTRLMNVESGRFGW